MVRLFVRALVVVVLALAVWTFIQRWRILAAGLRITSWFRTNDKNVRVGGVRTSRHKLGLAFDVTPANSVTMKKLNAMQFAKVLNEGDHFHVEVI
jgi:hypothetical protein